MRWELPFVPISVVSEAIALEAHYLSGYVDSELFENGSPRAFVVPSSSNVGLRLDDDWVDVWMP